MPSTSWIHPQRSRAGGEESTTERWGLDWRQDPLGRKHVLGRPGLQFKSGISHLHDVEHEPESSRLTTEYEQCESSPTFPNHAAAGS